MTSPWLALLAGAMVVGGLLLIVVGLTPARPDLAATVHRLLPTGDTSARTTADDAARRGWVTTRLLPVLAHRLGLGRYAADLRVTGRTVEHLAAQKVGYALLGLVFPVVITTLMTVAGVRPPLVVPVLVGLLLGVGLFFAPDYALRTEATDARAALRSATCAYIDLVALERLTDAGTNQALERAAVGASPQFALIRDALLRAQLGGRQAWTGLSDLADRTGVVELGDLADIMAVAGTDGAAVYTTLRARAASLRTQLLTAEIADANAASERMVIPVSLLGLCFMTLIAYPAFVRILFG